MNPSSFETTKYDGIRSLVVDLWIVSQDVATNKTVVGWQIHGGGTTTVWYQTRNIHLNLDGVRIYTGYEGSSFDLTNTAVVASGQVTITHNSDGSKTIPVYLEGGIYSFGSYQTVSGSSKINTIPRASTLTVSPTNTNIGTDLSFTISRATTSFTHKLEYLVTAADGYHEIANNIATSYGPWTIPLSLLNLYPDSIAAPLYFRLTTYDGTTQIGTPQVMYITVSVPTTVIPSVSLSITEAGEVPVGWGIWVKTKSKIHGILTDAGVSGSIISSRSTNANGTNYTTADFTTGFLQTVGDQNIVSIVRDSRGRAANDTKTINVVDYSQPSISNFKAIRCNSDGTPNNNGVYAKCEIIYNISPCSNKNAKTLKVVQGTTTKNITLSNYSGTIVTEVFAGITTSNSYLFVATIGDSFNVTGTPYTDTLGPSIKPFSVFNDGTGVSIGEVATDSNLFNVKLATRFKAAVTQVINGVEVPLGGVPTGVIDVWSFTEATIPIGYVKLEGQAISRTTYAALFALIGTTYGSGDGVNTFNVPDMRGKTPVGYDSTQTDFNEIGKIGGAIDHAHTSAGHTHTISHLHGLASGYALVNASTGWMYLAGKSVPAWYSTDCNSGTYSGSSVYNNWGAYLGGTTDGSNTANSGNTTPGNTGTSKNLQPYKTWLWIIKY